MWDAKNHEYQTRPHAAKDLSDFVNQLSSLDASAQGEAVELRVVGEDEVVPGGPVLVYTVA